MSSGGLKYNAEREWGEWKKQSKEREPCSSMERLWISWIGCNTEVAVSVYLKIGGDNRPQICNAGRLLGRKVIN